MNFFFLVFFFFYGFFLCIPLSTGSPLSRWGTDDCELNLFFDRRLVLALNSL